MICIRCDSESCVHTDKFLYGIKNTPSGKVVEEGSGYICEDCGYRFRDEAILTDFDKELIDVWRAARLRPVKFGNDCSWLFTVPSGKKITWTEGG